MTQKKRKRKDNPFKKPQGLLTFALDSTQLNRITRHAQIVLENLAGDSALNVGKGTMLAAEHLPKRSHVSLIAARLKPQAFRKKPAQPVKGQILLRLQPLPARQKQIQCFVPVIPIEPMLPQIQKHVPRIGRRATKQILNNSRSIVPPGFSSGRILPCVEWTSGHRVHDTDLRLIRKSDL